MIYNRKYYSNVKPFEKGTLLFLIVHDINTSANDVKNYVPNTRFSGK